MCARAFTGHAAAQMRNMRSASSSVRWSSSKTTAGDASAPLNRASRTLTAHASRGGAQAMMRACGMSAEDLKKPQVGIVSVWWEGNPCNCHLDSLAVAAKSGVTAAGMVGLRFNTVGVSDGISMGTRGMAYSLPSREIIADSIETVVRAQWYDACVTIPGCDKNMPGCIIAMARVNRPSIMVYGGTIASGCGRAGAKLDIISAFQSYGEFIAGRINDAARQEIVDKACPGPGACGGMYTANTMATAIEAMGLSLPYSSSTPALHPDKSKEATAAGAAIKRLLVDDIKPLDILNRKALENAIRVVLALGGSTNAVLHLLAIAKTAGVPLTLDDFQVLSDSTPYIGNLKPSGEFLMEDVHRIGGTPAILKYLYEEGLLHGDVMTVTGATMKQNLESVQGMQRDARDKLTLLGRDGKPQHVLRPVKNPLKPTGHITILKGNLAPEGAVAKLTGKEGLTFEGRALVFDCEEDFMEAFTAGLVHAHLGLPAPKVAPSQVESSREVHQFTGVDVPRAASPAVYSGPPADKLAVVVRYEGPRGGPGMPEMLTPSSAIMGAGLSQRVALITDGRFSGGSHGFLVGHVAPEAACNGPLALLRTGDTIRIDAASRTMSCVELDDAELARRRASHTARPARVAAGYLRKYIACVGSAAQGCVTDAL